MWIIRKRDKNKMRKYFYHFVALTMMITFIICSIVGYHNGYGTSKSWCWISDNHQAMRFYVFYNIFFISIGFCLTTVILASSKMEQSKSNSKTPSMDKSIKRRLQIYGSIFIMTWSISFLDRFVQYVTKHSWFPTQYLVCKESQDIIDAAKVILSSMDQDVLKREMSMLISRSVLFHQEDLINHFVEEGILTAREATVLVSTTKNDFQIINGKCCGEGSRCC